MSAAQKYASMGAEIDDLIQGGLIELLCGIEKYDSSMGLRFRPMFICGYGRDYQRLKGNILFSHSINWSLILRGEDLQNRILGNNSKGETSFRHEKRMTLHRIQFCNLMVMITRKNVDVAAAACKISLRYVVAFAGRGAKDVTRSGDVDGVIRVTCSRYNANKMKLPVL
ncbi:sigma factor A [Artemisia annua]|uniref:Sigma factor A n=1 Tax=Artemisia annua TaxID=35608 RepID=A0A2U1KT06_ARTAN|nr:sigma factor A [Artemisia annua]